VDTRSSFRTVVVECPDCEEDITLKGEIEWGPEVVCPHCGTKLEVINTDPVEVDWAYEESDDDYDDEDDEDDEY
jgi:lysine biosynthesis protein LysW